jgi:hypothetical protein
VSAGNLTVGAIFEVCVKFNDRLFVAAGVAGKHFFLWFSLFPLGRLFFLLFLLLWSIFFAWRLRRFAFILIFLFVGLINTAGSYMHSEKGLWNLGSTVGTGSHSGNVFLLTHIPCQN